MKTTKSRERVSRSLLQKHFNDFMNIVKFINNKKGCNQTFINITHDFSKNFAILRR